MVNATPRLSPARLDTLVAFMVLHLSYSPFATAFLDLPGEPRRLSRFFQRDVVVFDGFAAVRLKGYEPCVGFLPLPAQVNVLMAGCW